MNDIKQYSIKSFEEIKYTTKDGTEFWFARDLQQVLEYAKWDNFENVIHKAKMACKNSNIPVNEHFPDVRKSSQMPNGGIREINDIALTRYACYLIVQNSDPRKEVVALGQTYFAVQTRKQEINDFEKLDENERRLELRNSIKGFNKSLAEAAHNAGVINYGRFQNAGYMGLYNGETAGQIKVRKGLTKNQDILDHMGATELAANYFRITQTEEKLRKDNIRGENKANKTHFIVGKKVRDTMVEISGVPPEKLPTPDKSIKQLEQEHKKQIQSSKKEK